MLDILSKKHVDEKVMALLEQANTFLRKLGKNMLNIQFW